MRAHWGNVQKYRFLTFSGHIARFEETRLARRAQEWRDLRWWHHYRRTLPPVGPHQRGRRRRVGVPCRGEFEIADAFHAWINSAAALPHLTSMVNTSGEFPEDWQHLALHREMYREFARQAVWPTKTAAPPGP